jgi:hypothetical protein
VSLNKPRINQIPLALVPCQNSYSKRVIKSDCECRIAELEQQLLRRACAACSLIERVQGCVASTLVYVRRMV